MLVPAFEQKSNSIFQRQGNHVFKGATIEGKNMLPIGSIFFPLRVAPVRIENNFKGPSIEKLPKIKLCRYLSLLKLPN